MEQDWVSKESYKKYQCSWDKIDDSNGPQYAQTYYRLHIEESHDQNSHYDAPDYHDHDNYILRKQSDCYRMHNEWELLDRSD